MSDYNISKLRSGNGTASFICVLGTDLYDSLAKELDRDIDVYGIYVEEVSKCEPCFDTMDCDIEYVLRLKDYVDSYYNLIIENIRPVGPCYISGFSFGGYVAIELAKKLQNNGIQVPIIYMFDTFYIRNEKKLSLFKKLMAHYEMLKVHGFKKVIVNKLADKNIYRKKKFDTKNTDTENKIRKEKMIVRKKMAMSYRPDVYSGAVKLFTAGNMNPYTKRAYDIFLGWGAILSNITVHNIKQADHNNLLKSKNVRTIAKIISESLQL